MTPSPFQPNAPIALPPERLMATVQQQLGALMMENVALQTQCELLREQLNVANEKLAAMKNESGGKTTIPPPLSNEESASPGAGINTCNE